MKTIIISLGIILVVFSAVLSMTFFNDNDEMVVETTDQVISFAEANPNEPIITKVDAALQKAKGDLAFSGVKYSVNGNQIELSATVADSNSNQPVEGLDVNAFCNGLNSGQTKTDAEGLFTIIAHENCRPGDNAWVEVTYNEEVYEQSFIRMLGSSVTGGKNPSIKHSKITRLSQNPTGVPEFSTVTLAMAVIGGCLGLAILRKN